MKWSKPLCGVTHLQETPHYMQLSVLHYGSFAEALKIVYFRDYTHTKSTFFEGKDKVKKAKKHLEEYLTTILA